MESKYIFTLLFSSLFFSCYSQDTISYFNERWERVPKDSAIFYRIGQYNNGIYNGPIKDYWLSGKLQMKGEYSDWQMEGIFTWYNKKGKKICTGTYSNNETFTIQKAWDTLGTLVVNKGTGNFTWYNFHNNNISSQGAYLVGKATGIWIFYNSQGIKIEEMNYEKEKEILLNAWNYKGDSLLVNAGNGRYIRYFKNGRVKCIGDYKEGQKDGDWTWYYENGNYYLRTTYKNGKQHGSSNYYYENDQQKKTISMINGKADGDVIWFHDNGTISCRGHFKNGERSFEWIWYDREGNRTSTIFY